MDDLQENLLQQYQRYRSRLRKQLLLDVYQNNPLHGDSDTDVGEYYGYQFGRGRLNVFVLSLVSKRTAHGVTLSAMFSTAQRLLSDALLAQCPEGELCQVRDFLIGLVEEPCHADAMYAACFRDLRQSPAFYGVHLVMGVGYPCETPLLLRSCFDSAVSAMEHGVYLGYDQIYFINRLQTKKAPVPPLNQTHLDTLRRGLFQRNMEILEPMVEQVFEDYQEIFQRNPPAAYALPRIISQHVDNIVGDLPGREQLSQSIHQGLNRCTTVAEEKAALTAAFRGFCRLDHRSLSLGCAQALSYINAHFTELITLAQLGELVGLHPRYLGNLFQKETGETVTQYIRQKRLILTKHLLTSTSHSIAQIAQIVGYQDYRYLCRIFEKETGQSPGQYRKTMLAGRQEAIQRQL